MNSIAIIGLGYVGLPLALQSARSGARVLGLCIDLKKTVALNPGKSDDAHVTAESVTAQRAASRWRTREMRCRNQIVPKNIPARFSNPS